MAGEAPDITLDGTIERLVFKNEESGFIIARFETLGHEHVTIVGELGQLIEGQPLRLRGQWVVDKKYGRQFRVATYQPKSPETLVGIEKFLGSGIIPGIGPELAKRLVAVFGMDTLEVIDRKPERLTEVSGIGAHRASKIAEAFAAQRHVQDVMVFLQGHGVSAAFAARIVKKYGSASHATHRSASRPDCSTRSRPPARTATCTSPTRS
jgi:exodeoxyribonuclease V alpha subunit